MSDKIEVDINVNNNTMGGAETGETLQPNNNDKKTVATSAGNESMSKMINAGIFVAAGSRAVDYGLSHVGEWTGDSILQDKINATKKMTGYAALMAANPAAGILAFTADTATSMIDYSFKLKWQNREAERLRRRSGNYLSNGSRYK